MLWCRICFVVLLGWAMPAPFAAANSSQTAEIDQPDWRKNLGTFRVGIVSANRPLLAKRRAQPFVRALSDALGMPVELEAFPDFATMAQTQAAGRLEYAVYSATSFALAWKLCKCIQPLAAPLTRSGADGVRTVLFSMQKTDPSVETILRQGVLYGGASSFATFQWPAYQLRSQLPPSMTLNLINAGSVRTAVDQLYTGEASAMFGWEFSHDGEPTNKKSQEKNQRWRGTRDMFGSKRSNLKAVWRSPPVRFGPHAVLKTINEEAKLILWSTLQDLKSDAPQAYHAIEPRLGGGFDAVSKADYQNVIEMIEPQSQRSPFDEAGLSHQRNR